MGTEAVGLAFQGKDLVSPVVRGIRNTMGQFKRDAATGFGLAAGFNVWSTFLSFGGKAIDFMGDAVDAASDLQEATAKVNVVFGEGADEVLAWGDTVSTELGIVRREALEAVGTFGNFIQALGFAQDESQQMSMRLVELAADLASFNNTSVDEVLVALRSGLAGETEPMMRFGVDLRVARLEADLLAQGLAKTKSEITKGMRITAAYNAILSDTHMAHGDVERSAENLAMQQKFLNAQIETFKEDFGKALIPVMTAVVNVINDQVIPSLKQLGELIGSFDEGFARQLQVADAIDIVAKKLGVQSESLGDVREKWNMFAREGRNWTDSTEELAEAILDAEGSTIRAAEAAKAARVMFGRGAKAAGGATEEYEEMARALELVAGGLEGVRQEGKETERMWRRMAGGADRNKKRIRELREEIETWARRFRRALRQNDTEAAAFAQSQGARAEQELADRNAVKQAMNAERAALIGIGNAADSLDGKTATVTVDVIGKANVEAALRTISNLVAMSGNVVSVGLQTLGFGRRASGGPVAPGRSYLVGERGPEILTMGGRGGHVTPNHAMGGGGNVYLDGHWVGRLMDERMGRRYGMTAMPGSYRS